MISVDLEKCTGCKRCETVCSFFHSGRISSRLARIKVLNLYESGIDGPVLCVQCRERYCMECPQNALSLGDLGEVMVSPDLCTACGVCENACPIGAIEIFEDAVYVCDLCGGKPRCIEACTEGAISFEPETIEQVSLAEIKKITAGMNPGLKRHAYVRRTAAMTKKRKGRIHA